MKYRQKLLLFSGILLGIAFLFFTWLGIQLAAPVPEVSHPGGYYSDSILLQLSAPDNGTIYYTTDGSTPTAQSAVYQDGIPLQDRSGEENHYAAYRNVMVNWQDYIPDPTPVSKGTVVRAIYINNWGVSSEILNQTYFIGIPQPEEGYTISLIFEEDTLFGEDGIYVTGKEYDSWYLSGDTNLPEPEPNFSKRIEVPVTAQILDAEDEVMNQLVSLRLQGSSKRGWMKKRFILESSAELSGSNLFPTALFPDTSTHSVMTKDSITDAFVRDLVSDRNVSLQQSVPVHLYLNGEHLYSWYILERYDNQYFRQHHNVENVMLVKSSVVDEDVTIDADAYGELMYWVADTDFSDPEQWEQLNREVDLQSYIDFISINYYLCNWDFSDDKNHLMWRSLTDESTPHGDKRWRWCIYDIDALELTLNNYDVENAAEVNIFSCQLPYSDVRVNETAFFRSLKDVEPFRRQFVLSFMDMVNNNFSPEAVGPVLETYGLTLDWQDGYFLKRPDYAKAHLAEEFGLTGTPEVVSVSVADPNMGSIQVNTSRIDLSRGNWKGEYFTDYPITITAIANEGYEFLGWKGDADTTEDTITIPVDGGISLEAVFAKIE